MHAGSSEHALTDVRFAAADNNVSLETYEGDSSLEGIPSPLFVCFSPPLCHGAPPALELHVSTKALFPTMKVTWVPDCQSITVPAECQWWGLHSFVRASVY